MICLAPLLSMFFLSGCSDDGKTRIGIIQIVEHESLDNLREEFISELGKMGYKKGENAFATIKDALAKVSGGGTITLKDNVYNGNFVISKPVTIEGEGMVTVNGTFECAVQNITFKNLTITYNRTAAGESAIVLREGVSENSISARGCNFVNVAKGTAGVAVKSSSGKQANTNANAGGSGGSGKSKSETVKIETTAKPETKPEDVKSKTKSED